MPAQLSVHPAERASRRVLVEDGDTVTVGREPSCDLVVDDPRVSKRHARLEWAGSAWCLLDLGSKNGTSVNGSSAAGQELAPGDWLSFGGVPGRFELLTHEQATQRRQSRVERAATSVRLKQQLDHAAPEALLERLLDSAREVTAAERGFVVLVSDDGVLRVHATSGFEGTSEAGFTGSAGVVGRVAQTGQAFVVSDIGRDEVLAARPSVVARGLAAVACLPLRLHGRIAGFLYVDSRRPGHVLDDLDAATLEGLAEHAGLVLGAGDVHRRLRQLRVAAGVAPALEQHLLAVRVHGQT